MYTISYILDIYVDFYCLKTQCIYILYVYMYVYILCVPYKNEVTVILTCDTMSNN